MRSTNAAPDAFGLVCEEGGELRHPTKPARARVAVGLASSSVLLDIDLPEDYKESAGYAWDNDVPEGQKPGLYDVEVAWIWDSEWSEWHGKSFESFYIQAVRWPDGKIVGDEAAFALEVNQEPKP